MKIKIRPHTLTVETVYTISLNGEPVGMVIRLSPVQWVLSLEGRATRSRRDVVKTYGSLTEARREAMRLATGRAPTKAGGKTRRRRPAPKPTRKRAKTAKPRKAASSPAEPASGAPTVTRH